MEATILRLQEKIQFIKTIRRYLFEKTKTGGPKQKKTKTGQYATGEEI
jgi:DNA polymerase-1